jgi:hypothetical protein
MGWNRAGGGTHGMESARRDEIVEMKRRLGDGRARFDAIDRALRPDIERVAALGGAVVPQVGWSMLAAGAVPPDLPEQVRRHGCVVVRGVFAAGEAADWNAEIAAYLARNEADRRTSERIGADRYAARWQGGRPQIYSVYWSPPQVRARQSPALAAVRGWLNGLWRSGGAFDPAQDCSYADRIRRRTPGDATLGLGPHIDGGTTGRWLGPTARPYQAVFAGSAFDPFDAAHRTVAADPSDRNACGVFRTWQGWTALTAQGPGDGTLQVVPIAQAIAWVLLRPFAADVPEESLCGAEASPALRLTPQWHASLLRALVPIPRVEAGDTVWWHPDLIHAVEARHTGGAESNVMYIPAAPDCPRNRAFLARQLPSFVQGRSPPDFPADDLETDFVGRAGPDFLSALGRRQMGVD